MLPSRAGGVQRSGSGTGTEQVKAKTIIRCPKCHARFPFPRGSPICPKCREHLIKCRYCHFADLNLWECTHPEINRGLESQPEGAPGQRVHVDLDVPINCRFHRSLLIYNPKQARRRLLFSILSGLVWGGLIALVVWATVQVGLRLYLYAGAPPRLVLLTFCPEEVEKETPVRISFVIQNKESTDSDWISLQINPQFFNFFKLNDIQPPPQNIQITTTGWLFSFPPVPGNSQMYVEMNVTPLREGTARLVASMITKGKVAYVGRKKKIDIL